MKKISLFVFLCVLLFSCGKCAGCPDIHDFTAAPVRQLCNNIWSWSENIS